MKSKKALGAWLICLFMLYLGGTHLVEALGAHNTVKICMNVCGIIIFVVLMAVMWFSDRKRPTDDANFLNGNL